MERDKRNELMFQYVQARMKSDAADRHVAHARTMAAVANHEMQEAWLRAKADNPEKGVYTFREHGRVCVAVTGGDYPALSQIVP